MVKIPIALLLSVWFVVIPPEITIADTWRPPHIMEVFSESREYFVRVIPGSLGHTPGSKRASRVTYARAELYQRQESKSYRFMKKIKLVNPLSPVEIYVSNTGYWATLDNWANMGYGQMVVFYDFKGQLIRSYKLADLFVEKEIAAIPHSISSFHWRKQPTHITPDQKALYVSVAGGGSFTFRLETGSYQFCESRGNESLCRSENLSRRWVPFDPN